MGKTIRYYKGEAHRDKSEKKGQDRKQFVYRDEGYTTKAQGGPGNKRAWGGSAGVKVIPKFLYQRYKEKDLADTGI